MQLEDVLRIRQSDEQNRQQRIELQQETLVKQLHAAIKRVTAVSSDKTNKLLSNLIEQIKEHNR